MNAEVDPVVTELSQLVFQAADRMRRGFTATAIELGLSGVQAAALVKMRSPAPMRDLAEILFCDASNVTAIVDGLEQHGLVVRQPDPKDRRVKQLVLTKKGERRKAELIDRGNANASKLFELSKADRNRLRDLLAAALDGSADELAELSPDN